jgi:hypothetical protein
MHNFSKVLCIGTTKDVGDLWVKVQFNDGNLSLSGVEGPKLNGDARGSCGQIVMHEWDFKSLYEGWDADKVKYLREVWDEWHLNNLTAGSPAQREWLANNPAGLPGFDYDARKDALSKAGLEPDASYLHNGKPYSYGSAWLKREVPDDVLMWLSALPEAKRKPEWI